MQEKFARFHVLFFMFMKRDWRKIALWVIGLGLFSAGFVPAFEEMAKGQGLIGMYETLQNPAMTAIVGPTPISSAENYSLGAMYAHEMLLFCGLFTMIVSALHVVGHTRKEEDLGQTELIRSFQVGRQANALALMKEVFLINLLLTIFIGSLMLSFSATTITAEGAYLFGASIGLAGLLGASFALFFAQIMPSSSSATASTLALIGLLYILRAGTDASQIFWSKINPLGWTYLTFPFTENHWFFLIYGFIFVFMLTCLAFVLEGHRDMGQGYLPQREGRAQAKKSLLSIPGLFLRLTRGTILAWLLAFLILGASYGSIYGDMQSFLESNAMIEEMFMQTGVSIEASFTSTIMNVMIGLVAILPIVLVNKAFTEERKLHLSQIYATPTSRFQLYWTTLAFAIITSILGILFSVIGLGGTALQVLNQGSNLGFKDFLLPGFNYLPAVLFFVGLTALALGWMPRMGKMIYMYLAYSFLLSYFEGVLDLPQWVTKTAVQTWLPDMPMEDFDFTIFITLLIVSVFLMVLGYIGYRNRDFLENA